MTAAIADPDGHSSYAARILGAHTGHDLNELAAEVAVDDTISVSSRRTLQLLFGNRMRQLWPNSFGRHR